LFIQALNYTNAFNIKQVNASANATQYALDNKLTSLLVIPKGFENQTMVAKLTNGTIKASLALIYDQSSSTGMAVVGIINGVINQFDSAISSKPSYIDTQLQTIAPTRYGYIDFFTPGIMAMSAMTLSIFGAVEVNTRYRENGIMHKVETTPMTRFEWILSKTIFRILMSFFSMAIILGIGILAFNLKVTIDAVSLLLLAACSMLFSGIGMVLSRFVKDADAADSAANAVTFPMMFLSGTFFPLEMMPPFIRSIATVLPLTYVNNGLRDAMIYGQQQSAIYYTAIITVLGVAVLIIGSFITKWEED
jgi:ABC-2 type transport system permease protein